MGLVGERPATVGETLDEGHLPQGPRAVKLVRVEVRRPLAQLVVAARRR